MAINKVPFASTTPAAISDYQKQNALIAALVGAIDGAQKVIGANVVKGAVFNVGGTLYLADADTAITGTASNYVKLTPSGDTLTLAASFVASLSGVTWNETYKGYYDTSGNLYEFDESDAYLNGAISAIYSKDGQSRIRHGSKAFFSSGTFVVPPGVKKIKISGCAAGGNGSGNTGTTAGAGGGGGEWAIKEELVVTPGDSLTVTIGAVGANTAIGSFVLHCGSSASSYTGGAAGSGGNGKAGGAGGDAGKPGSPSFAHGGAPSAGGGGGGSYCGGGHGAAASTNGYQGGYGGGGGGGGGTSSSGGSGGPAFLEVEW